MLLGNGADCGNSGYASYGFNEAAYATSENWKSTLRPRQPPPSVVVFAILAISIGGVRFGTTLLRAPLLKSAICCTMYASGSPQG